MAPPEVSLFCAKGVLQIFSSHLKILAGLTGPFWKSLSTERNRGIHFVEFRGIRLDMEELIFAVSVLGGVLPQRILYIKKKKSA